MADILFACPAAMKATLAALMINHAAVIGPVPGRAAITYADLGVTVPAAGDPSLIYYNVRPSGEDVSDLPPTGCSAIDSATSASVLGVWAGDTP